MKKIHLAELLIALLVMGVLYVPLKYLIRGTLPYIPEGGGIDLPFIVGVIFMIFGIGLAIYHARTHRIEILPAVSFGVLIIVGFILVHLAMSGYEHPVAVVPLSFAISDVQPPVGQDYLFLVPWLLILGNLILIFNMILIV